MSTDGGSAPARWMAVLIVIAVVVGIALGYWVFNSLT